MINLISYSFSALKWMMTISRKDILHTISFYNFIIIILTSKGERFEQ